MEVIPRETRKITYSTEIRNLIKKLTLNDHQMAVLIGTILGDGHLEPNWSKTNYKLKINHCLKHRNYTFWKYRIFKDWVLTKPKFDRWNNSFQFRTVSHREITKLRNKFYKNGKKIIPRDIRKYLKNPITLAVWFMDDGNIKGTAYNINTQSYSKNENKLLAKCLLDLHGITANLEKNHQKYYRLYIPKLSARIFENIVRNFVTTDMKYKLG